MPFHEGHEFTAAPEEHEFEVVLFDMDGTIIDSTDAIVKYWRKLGGEIGVDGNEILKSSHGRRSIDTLALWAPQLANWDFICKQEMSIPLEYGKDAVEIPGSRALLDSLSAAGAPWAIVTSGTRPLVDGWVKVMNLARPKALVTAEEVENGKPDPACYRLGAKRLGFEDVHPSRVLVLEDAPAGVKAGKAAGFKVVAVATTHSIDSLQDAGADWIVKDLRSVALVSRDSKSGTTVLRFSDGLVRRAVVHTHSEHCFLRP